MSRLTSTSSLKVLSDLPRNYILSCGCPIIFSHGRKTIPTHPVRAWQSLETFALRNRSSRGVGGWLWEFSLSYFSTVTSSLSVVAVGKQTGWCWCCSPTYLTRYIVCSSRRAIQYPGYSQWVHTRNSTSFHCVFPEKRNARDLHTIDRRSSRSLTPLATLPCDFLRSFGKGAKHRRYR